MSVVICGCTSILDAVEKPHFFCRDRLGHDWRYAIDNTRITTELGWSPKYTFEKGYSRPLNGI